MESIPLHPILVHLPLALAVLFPLVAGLAVAGSALAVGHSGGELVYRHGAAAAWAASETPGVDGAAVAATDGSAR